MSFVIDSDEKPLVDITDFSPHFSSVDHNSQLVFQLIGKSGKRKHSLNTCGQQRLSTTEADIDEDSGFCGSNHSPNINKTVRFDDEMHVLKARMGEVNEPVVTTQGSQQKPVKTQNSCYSSKSKNGEYELKIVSEPEEQHRARYRTEGSRRAIRDRSGLSHPIVKLCGFNRNSVEVQCFIGQDKQLGSAHLFYQALKITGKTSTRCTARQVDGTTVILMDACPENDMHVTVDCVGILKERYVDVQQKLTHVKTRADDAGGCVRIQTKKRSTRCRLVFRAQIPESKELLQVVSSPILCTQPIGTPEICRTSVSQCDAKGGHELFIIGKNFQKNSTVVWKSQEWHRVVEPDRHFSQPTHLICIIPSYEGPELKNRNSSIEVLLSIRSGGKYSESQKFTFTNYESVHTMTLVNGTTAQASGNSTSAQLLIPKFLKPIIAAMVGPTTTANSSDSQMVVHNSVMIPIRTNQLSSDTVCYTNANSSVDCVMSVVVSEGSQMSSNLLNSTTLESDSRITKTFNDTNDMSLNKTSDERPDNRLNEVFIANICFKIDETLDMKDLMCGPQPQYLSPKSFESIPSNSIIVDNSSQMTDLSLLSRIPSTPMSTTSLSVINSEPTLSMVDSMSSMSTPIHLKSDISQESIATKCIIAENPVLTSTPSTTPVTQATNICALSKMSDAELLCFINPATFD